MKRTLIVVGGALAALMALSAVMLAVEGGCSGGNIVLGDDAALDDDAAIDDDSAGPAIVYITEFAFTPGTATVPLGGAVTWINRGSLAHHVQSGNPGDATAGSVFDSGVLPPSASYSFTFNTAGTYFYFCALYPTQMRGASVIVE